MNGATIAALATPPGRGALALIRISGRDAFGVAARVLDPFRAAPARVARRAGAHAVDGSALDEVLYVAYAAPASYTGEDAVEITTHGGVLVPAEVLAACLVAGARSAEPGEFTRRALLNGKLDLVQAEATGDLVAATAPAQRRAALHQLDRGLSDRIAALREAVLQVEALLAYDIDFPEEDDGPVAPERVAAALAALAADLESLLATAGDGERLHTGALCVIAGAPNVGKSSLFNALLGRDRALVTDEAGTTRDAIEADVTCDGFPFRLVDTAGLRAGGDRIERMGIEVSHRYLGAADVVLYCVAPDGAIAQEFLEQLVVPVLVVRTKADREKQKAHGAREIDVSAVTGVGLPELRGRLAELAFQGLVAGGDPGPMITRARHRHALERALAEVHAFEAARRDGLEAAVAATHLRVAVGALEDVIGVVAPEEILDRLFAGFCVGK